MKKVLAALLCGALAVGCLAGCGGGGDDAGAAGGNAGGAAGTEAAGGNAGGNASGDYPTVVMAYMNWAGAPAGLERIQGLINDYTEENLGVSFELEIMDSASYSQNMKLMLSSGEQIDLFNAISVGYTASVNNGYCLDLEEDDLIQNYGQGILDTMDEVYVNACRIDGTLYGLP